MRRHRNKKSPKKPGGTRRWGAKTGLIRIFGKKPVREIIAPNNDIHHPLEYTARQKRKDRKAAEEKPSLEIAQTDRWHTRRNSCR